MRPQVLARVGLVSLIAALVGLALGVGVLGTGPSPWSSAWTAAVFMLSVVGLGLLTMGLAFRDLDTPAPPAEAEVAGGAPRAASRVRQPEGEGRPLVLDGVHAR